MNHTLSILASGDDGLGEVIAVIIGLIIVGIKAMASVGDRKGKPAIYAPPPPPPQVIPPLPPPLGSAQKPAQRRITPGRPSQGKSFTSKAKAFSKLANAPGKPFNRPGEVRTISYAAELPAPVPRRAAPGKSKGNALAAPPRNRLSASLPPQAEQLSPVTQPPRPTAGSTTDGHKSTASQVSIDSATLRRTLRPANLRALIALNEILLPPLALRHEDAFRHSASPGE